MTSSKKAVLQIDIEEVEKAIINGCGDKQYKKIRKLLAGDLTVLNGATEAIYNQLELTFQLNEPVGAYLLGRFRKDKACYWDLQYSVYFLVSSSTNKRTIDYLMILSKEQGPNGKDWCTNCIKTIQSKIDENQLDGQ
ncbi:MAG: hypothetical protein IPK50_09535 [Fibrobacterota bacterium]|nr:hypothetical protein [Fibrobacterota bacterium]QQS07120.1 MAG: hypothetical protein IPK50_09535 [Fibrobacterota bacterium]